MSEYWVSHKRYRCKYCEIFIADDKPSRLQHENGLRHKSNVERFVRGLYKEGQKRVRDLAEEKAIMASVDKAAGAAYAHDIASGSAHASAPSSARPASPPPPPMARARARPAQPSSAYANYTTAAELGYTDPDAEEAVRRRGMGVVGEWTVVTPRAVGADGGGAAGVDGAESRKRASADADDDEEDVRTFKLRKKTVRMHDEDVLPVKLKKKEETTTTSESTAPAQDECNSPVRSKWTKVEWKRAGVEARPASDSPPPPAAGVKKEEGLDVLPAMAGPTSTAGLFRKRKHPAHRRAL